MANDRMYLRCPKCGEVFLLAKFWGGAQWEERPAEELEHLGPWLTRHAGECLEQWGGTLARDSTSTGFELHNETIGRPGMANPPPTYFNPPQKPEGV
jgi:hypothetical protein